MAQQQLRRWDVTGKNEIRLVSFDLPELPDDQVRLEFVCNGVCGSDTHMFHTGAVHSGHKGEHQPLTLGHELIARVKTAGKDVTTLAVGDVVAVEPGLPCGKCPNCLKGRYHCCPKTMYMGTPPQNGGLADEFQWPAKWCHKLPAALAADPVLASLVEPLAACRQAWELREKIVERADDEWTVVTGSGAMALGVVAIIKAINPNEKVAVVARNARALAFATKFGADATFQLSDIDPKAIADEVTAELAELFQTNHFDGDDAVIVSTFGDSPVRLAAARAASAAVSVQRERGAHQDDIEDTMRKAAKAAAVKAQVEENKAVFLKVSQLANGFVSSLFECTGDERLLETIIEGKVLLADGAIIGLGCHYGVSFDVAHLRRLELAFQPVRRSCNQFPATLELLETNADQFRQLVGGTVTFEDFGGLMTGDVKATTTGSGGPKTVVVKK